MVVWASAKESVNKHSGQKQRSSTQFINQYNLQNPNMNQSILLKHPRDTATYTYKTYPDELLEKEAIFCQTNTMPTTALHSTFCMTSQSSPSSSSSIPRQQLLATKPSSLLQNHPLYPPTHANLSLQIQEKIICLEIMGVDSGKALSLNPSLHSAPLHSIHSIIHFLQSKGLHHKDLPRIFGMCPKLLTADIKTDLTPVFNFLSHDLKVPESNFRRVINKCPRLLASSARDQLKPALFYLQRLGFKDLEALAYQDSVLLVCSVENTLIPKLKYIECIGFSRQEAVVMVLRCPALFTYSVEKNFKPKFEYFVEQIKGELEDLKEFPQYFAFSLEKRIKPRHMEAVQAGIRLALPTLLKPNDDEFNDLIKRGPGPA